MNDHNLSKLFAAARNEPAPTAPAEFSADVLRAIGREPAPRPAMAASVFDHLNGLFPRVGLAAAAIIVLCVAADLGVTAIGMPGVDDGTAQVASQYLFNSDDL